MRVVIQRVKEASVTIGGTVKDRIGKGLLVLAGIENADDMSDMEWISGKIAQLRIFDDAEGIMNLSVMDTGGSIMVISQFTLHAKTKKGNRPSYIMAAGHEVAIPLYEGLIKRLSEITGKRTACGEFGAMMDIGLINDGPVTIIIDSKNKDF